MFVSLTCRVAWCWKSIKISQKAMRAWGKDKKINEKFNNDKLKLTLFSPRNQLHLFAIMYTLIQQCMTPEATYWHTRSQPIIWMLCNHIQTLWITHVYKNITVYDKTQNLCIEVILCQLLNFAGYVHCQQISFYISHCSFSFIFFILATWCQKFDIFHNEFSTNHLINFLLLV